MNTTALFFTANILYCTAYVVRDMMWLRIISIVAAFTTFPYFMLRVEVLWSAVLWQCAFAGINIVNLAGLIRERRPVDLTVEQKYLHQLVFRGLTPRQMLRFLDLAEWRDARPGELLIEQGSLPERLLLIVRGRADVKVGGALVAQLVHGRFAGEMGYLSDSLTSADVIATTEMRYLSWRNEDLDRLCEESELFRRYLPMVLGQDMATKLRETGTFEKLTE